MGFCIRFWASTHQPVFSEEAFSVYEAKFWTFPYDPSYPPGYPLFVKFWTYFSTDLTWIRLPNVVAGSVSIVIFWQLLRRNLSTFHAHIGAFLLSVSALHIHYSWVSRPHAFATLSAILSLSLLLKIAKGIAGKKLPGTGLLAEYFIINTIGAFLSHGYTLFLAGSFVSIIIWLRQQAMLKALTSNKAVLFTVGLHCLLPIIQYGFIHGRIGPLADSAEWIPDISPEMIVSVFLTLFNTTKTLTGELYASSLVVVYITLIVIAVIFRALYLNLQKKHAFLAIMLISSTVTALVGALVVYNMVGLSILQPRLLLSLHILYIIGMVAAIPTLYKHLRHLRSSVTMHSIEAIFLTVFIIFSFRSLLLLNLHPYYNTNEDIQTIKKLADDTEGIVLVFPRYELITVHYLWGINDNVGKPLRYSYRLMNLPYDAPLNDYITLLPTGKPFTVIHWRNSGALTPGARRAVDMFIQLCPQKSVKNIDILSCPAIPPSP